MVDSQKPRRCRNICQWNRAGSRGHSCAVGCWLARNEGKFCVGRNFTMQYKTTDRAWCGGGGGPLSVEFIYTDSSSSSSFCNAFQAAEKMEAGKKAWKKLVNELTVVPVFYAYEWTPRWYSNWPHLWQQDSFGWLFTVRRTVWVQCRTCNKIPL